MTQLHVYDFDGTLYDSPVGILPSWWLYVQSLHDAGLPGFDSRWNIPLLIQARRSAQTPLVRSILVTGRPDYKEMRDKIESLLHNAGLDFEEIHLKPLYMNCSTAEYKAAIIEDFVDEDPSITKVVVWDDLEENHDAISAVLRARNIPYQGIVVHL